MARYKENDSTVDFEKNIQVLRNYSLIALGVKIDIFKMYRLV